jgi:hypothetical protein
MKTFPAVSVWLCALILLASPGCSCSQSDIGDGHLDGGDPTDGTDPTDDGGSGGDGHVPGCGMDACTEGDVIRCGPIQDPCSASLVQCGSCPDGLSCGVSEPSVCGEPTGGGGADCTEGLCEHQHLCEGVGEFEATTLTGTVYLPDGETPLNGAVVYVPNNANPDALPPISEGASCERCEDEDLGSPIAGAITRPDGTVTLRHVPAGVAFPLVVKAGKWRRVVMIDEPLEPCGHRELGAAQTRLPRNQSEGHLPRIAMVTGGVDALECVLHMMGVDAEEFTRPDGGGRIHMYISNGAWADEELRDTCRQCDGNNCTYCNNHQCGSNTFSSTCRDQRARNLYRDQAVLDGYDMVFFGCDWPMDGGTRNSTWTEEDHARLKAYGDKGGRIFLSHFNHEWLSRGRAPQELRDLADYSGSQYGDLSNPTYAWVDNSFTRGLTFLQWLEHVNATHGDFSEGHIEIDEPRARIRELHDPAQRWVYTTEDPHDDDTVQSFTFDMPLDAADGESCGRTVYSAFHVVDGDDMNEEVFPQHCADLVLTPQALALVFMMFDLAACITDQPPAFDCIPLTCAEEDQCGHVVDGCGGLDACGDCSPGQLCNPATNRCQTVG